MNEIILASASPRRADILSQLNIPFLVLPSEADETLPENISCADAVVLLSQRKASACILKKDKIVLAADTLVTLNDLLMGKPKDDSDAFRMLSMLSGKTHFVYTGVALSVNGKLYSGICKTAVTFRELSESDIQSYILTGEPKGKAGAYAIQGQGAALIRSVCGDYNNVVGLPVSTLIDLFNDAEISISKLMGVETVVCTDI